MKAASARAGRKGDLERGCARHGVGGELLADATDGAASLGERRHGHARPRGRARHRRRAGVATRARRRRVRLCRGHGRRLVPGIVPRASIDHRFTPYQRIRSSPSRSRAARRFLTSTTARETQCKRSSLEPQCVSPWQSVRRSEPAWDTRPAPSPVEATLRGTHGKSSPKIARGALPVRPRPGAALTGLGVCSGAGFIGDGKLTLDAGGSSTIESELV